MSRRDYEIQQAAMRRLLGVDHVADAGGGAFSLVPDQMVQIAVPVLTWLIATLKQAERYMKLESLRSSVVRTVLEVLPDEGDIVIVAHSLGSLVAIDLLDHLPERLTVQRLITLGSPGGLPALHEHSERLLRQFPYGAVRSWLNVLSTGDPIPAGRGLASLFPAAQDMRVDLPAGEHGAARYLSQPKVALAVGEALFGSLSTEVVLAPGAPTIRSHEAEAQVLFAMAFAHMTLNELHDVDSQAADRYEHALAVVQEEVAQRLLSLAQAERRAISPEVVNLAQGQPPACPRRWSGDLDAAIRMLVVAATTNLVAPWDIDVNESARRALEPAAVGLGFGAQHGRRVREAITAARKGLGLSKSVDWAKILAGAAGLGLLLAGPVGLIAAAPAGLFGAAAITGALAAFGPGGMVGGMMVAGTLIGTGAVTATSALLAQSSQVVVETEVLRRMAHADARARLRMPKDLGDWALLTELESQIAAELARLLAFSDEKSATVLAARRKSETLARAIKWMLERNLGPDQLAAA